MGTIPHNCNGFPGQHKLPEVYRYPFHPSKQDMIATADIEDQELTVGTERTSIHHPTVAWRSNLGACTGSDGNSFFCAAAAIRGTEFLQFYTVNRNRNLPAQ